MDMNVTARRFIVLACCMITGLAFTPRESKAQTLTTIFSFDSEVGGTLPEAGVIQGRDGSFYGTTYNGGAFDYGTVFKLSSSGKLTTLHSFNASVDGYAPYASLVQGTDGFLYGTTIGGGGAYFGGTVFKISPSGAYTLLHAFTDGLDGDGLYGSLIQAMDGNFYGTTGGGGASNDGTVFKITPTGTLTTIYSFVGGSRGAVPEAGVVQGTDGNFYGTTISGGVTECGGYGTVYQLTPQGVLTSLHAFTNGPDGSVPVASLVQGTDGYFYGTTYGVTGNTITLGSAFKVSPNNGFTTLHTFTDVGSEGGFEQGGLLEAGDGNFYGTNQVGGTYGDGTVYEVTPSGEFKTIHSFSGNPDGAGPLSTLAQGRDGFLYGTTIDGGANDEGAVFKVPGPIVAPAIIELAPNVGTVGARVTITGTNFFNVKSVSFNGIMVKSFTNFGSYITTDVPVGASTGSVTVTAEDGTGVSPANFTVYQAPTIKAVDPVAGVVGGMVEIYGANLTNVKSVKFNGVLAALPLSITSKQLTVRVPNGATSGPVTVTTLGGTAVSPDFTVIPASTLTGFSLAKSSVTGGVSDSARVTISSDAPADGTVVTLSSSGKNGQFGPATVTVPAGTDTVKFDLTTQAVTTSKAFTLTASVGNSDLQASLTVNP